jgi:hypothetical protein
MAEDQAPEKKTPPPLTGSGPYLGEWVIDAYRGRWSLKPARLSGSFHN